MTTKRVLYNHLLVLASTACLTFQPILAQQVATTSLFGGETEITLQGRVSKDDFKSKLASNMDNLLSKAIDRNAKAQDLIAKLERFKGKPHRIVNLVKVIAKDLRPFEGFANSKEAAALLLDEEMKPNDHVDCAYQLQKIVDQTQPKIVSSVLEMAMGLGQQDKDYYESRKMVRKGFNSLAAIVGEKEALATGRILKEWYEQSNEKLAPGKPWDIETYQRNISCATEAALQQDPLIIEAGDKLMAYRHPGGAKETICGILQSIFDITQNIGIAPGVAAVSEFAKEMVVQGGGGAERDKVLNELYLSRSMESRSKSVSSQMQLAMTSYQMATVQGNKLYADCSQAIVSTLASDELIMGVIAQHLLAGSNNAQ